MATSFPKLSVNQVVLMRVDAYTGNVLNSHFDIAIGNANDVYTFFDSLEEALLYVEHEVKKRQGMESVIYNSQQEVIHYYNPFDKGN